MTSTNPAPKEDGEPTAGRHERALAVATDGLKLIRDESPPTEPAYPAQGSVAAHEAWAFDSASYERAQTAQDALDRVDEIMRG